MLVFIMKFIILLKKYINLISYRNYKKYFIFFNTIYHKKFNISIYKLEFYKGFYNNFRNKKKQISIKRLIFLLFFK